MKGWGKPTLLTSVSTSAKAVSVVPLGNKNTDVSRKNTDVSRVVFHPQYVKLQNTGVFMITFFTNNVETFLRMTYCCEDSFFVEYIE